MSQLVRDLFVSDVTRDIPPVVYFHEQSPEKLQQEVAEYIITGGFHEGSLQRQRVPDGIHGQAVRLCTPLAAQPGRARGPGLPNRWLSRWNTGAVIGAGDQSAWPGAYPFCR